MSLLTNITPAAPSLESKKARLNFTARQTAKSTYQSLLRTQKAGIALVWANDGLTPQEACDALGTLAAATFALHGALTDAVIAMANIDGVQPDIALPTFAFTVNPDGTVTVLDTPYVP